MYAGDEFYDDEATSGFRSVRWDNPQCRFCKRYDVIAQGLFTRVKFPDGIALVCDICREKADEPDEDAHFEWHGHDIEVEVV